MERRVISICSGVFPMRRKSWVSVISFVGMRLRMAIFKGRISWVCARVSSMTKMFSCVSIFAAGNVAGILTGIGHLP